MNDLAEFFKKKKEALDKWETNKKQQLSEWQQALDQLTLQLTKWLRPAVTQGLKIKPYFVEISEEVYGTYNAPALELVFGPTSIHIKPVALAIVGASGRVDIESPKGTFILVRRPGTKDWFLTRAGRWNGAQVLNEEVFTELIKEIFS